MGKINSNAHDSLGKGATVKYEEILVKNMHVYGITLSEALTRDLNKHLDDPDSVYDVVDFLEEKLESLDKVQYYMQVLTGIQPDVILKENHAGTRGPRS